MAQVNRLKDKDSVILVTKIFDLKEEISEVKIGMHKLCHRHGLGLFPLIHNARDNVPISILSDDDDCKQNRVG